jgi:hypothetical protein
MGAVRYDVDSTPDKQLAITRFFSLTINVGLQVQNFYVVIKCTKVSTNFYKFEFMHAFLLSSPLQVICTSMQRLAGCHTT